MKIAGSVVAAAFHRPSRQSKGRGDLLIKCETILRLDVRGIFGAAFQVPVDGVDSGPEFAGTHAGFAVHVGSPKPKRRVPCNGINIRYLIGISQQSVVSIQCLRGSFIVVGPAQLQNKSTTAIKTKAKKTPKNISKK